MGLILELLREDPEKIKESQRKRGFSETIVERVKELDKRWRTEKYNLDKARHKRNKLTRKIANLEGEAKQEIIEEAKSLSHEIEKTEEEVKQLEEKRNDLLFSIPNVLHESVPVGEDEGDNVPVKYWGRPKIRKKNAPVFEKETGGETPYAFWEFEPKDHISLLEKLGGADFDKAAQVTGSRFYYLTNDVVWLDMALLTYALDFMSSKGFTVIEPPFLLREAIMKGVLDLNEFKQAIYKIEGENLYLIGTSEHPLAALHSDETLPKDDLPLTYTGISPCFRKEAGTAGRTTKGLYRVHRFNKVEQFVFSLPENSWEWHETLLEHAEGILRELKIPYRVVNVCTSDIGAVAAKKYDIQAWMPGPGEYREVVSCSNCLDYQAVRLNIRYGEVKGGPAEGFVHTLNSTALATSRTIIALLENYQQEDGSVKIPRVLRPYLKPYQSAPKTQLVPLRQKENA
ncbi:MAG: serine--tRNA ligase [Candidatus Korarchaeota archaeon]|nr:serine--tRNA ligase [Candidatus Korarchaeota archaeon]NIU82730.1 serine--tRNA ligase [Candidatus Thorarchaeota archaeon]NIW14152.1 serine--tRNA ligase [Candidatus Thorarchaeota archaeon]NIW52255.1 serine--tRNA ligase [Candidatus Korarchaeota archaeon]